MILTGFQESGWAWMNPKSVLPELVTMKLQTLVFSICAATVATAAAALPSMAMPATLIARETGSRINVRSAPTTTAKAPHYGVSGDRIEVTRAVMGQDNFRWNYVKFASGAAGWVRSDFVSYNREAEFGILAGNPGDRINIRSAPSTKANAPNYGLQGDVVQMVRQTRGSDGYTWHFVQFTSGAQGWVRGDLIQAIESGC